MNKKGFTLVEVIIAIAAMAVLGGFIMQMFVMSQSINQSAAQTDQALERASAVISDFKTAKNAQAFWEGIAPGTYSGGEDSLSLYYDAEWKPCPEEEAAVTVTVTMSPSDLLTVLGCVDLRILVTASPADGGSWEKLADIRTARYFGPVRGGDPA